MCARVEKILRKRRRKGVAEYHVRWKGQEDPKFDSWVQRMARQVLVYKLKDDAGEILDGTFYEPELQRIIKNDDCTASRRFCGRVSVKE